MAGMMTGLLLLLLVGVTVGRVVDLQKRILGGKECGKTDRLYHVKLVDGKGELVCGGSLIHNHWILTAAHCVPDKSKVQAVLGVHPGTNPKTVNIINVRTVHSDPRLGMHDIALLELEEPATGFEIVKLPDCKQHPLKGAVQIAGHATTGKAKDGTIVYGESANLLCADTEVAVCGIKDCASNTKITHHSFEEVFCYEKTGVDASMGDSGGGVMSNKMIYGVHIRIGPGPCSKYTPRAMAVCEYHEWITHVTSRTFPSTCPTCRWKCLTDCLKG